MLSLVLATICSSTPSAAADGGKEAFEIIHVDQLEQMLHDTKTPVHVFDANNDEFRKKEGIIPGAVLLDGHDFDMKVLPADKSATLVFYCSNKL
jgi:hypothetical protein